MNGFEELRARGFVRQMTHPELEEKISQGGMTFYVGFDPTADSLHVGHFLALMAMRRLQKIGHRPVVILGGGTAVVGDPTGKMEMRKMLDRQEIDANAKALETQFRRFLTLGDGPTDALMLNNADWLLKLNYLEFLREFGVHFSVNRMLTYESVRLRLEKGLTFLEFNYNLLQAYDFYHLFKTLGCTLQVGGDDQWANITAGMELIRRKEQGEAFGLTYPLITTSSGAKMGKTEKGAVWLDPDKTSPYDFYQFWINVDDANALPFLKFFTDLPLEEIAGIEAESAGDPRIAKRHLAFEVTALVHGIEEAQKARSAAEAAFGAARTITPDQDLPTVELSADALGDRPLLAALLADLGILSSRGEAKRLVAAGGLYINEQRVDDPLAVIGPEAVDTHGQIIVRQGKKRYHRIMVKDRRA